jgi:hypothetical protein
MGLFLKQTFGTYPEIVCDVCGRVYSFNEDLLECPSDDCPSNINKHSRRYSEVVMAWPGDEPSERVSVETPEEEIDLSALGWGKPK